jgi:hypothetical protein
VNFIKLREKLKKICAKLQAHDEVETMNDQTKNETNVAATPASTTATPAAETAQPASSPGVTQLGSPTPGTETPVSPKRPLMSDADIAELEAIADRLSERVSGGLRAFMQRWQEDLLTLAEQAAEKVKGSIHEGIAAAEAAKAKMTPVPLTTSSQSVIVTPQIIPAAVPDPTVTAAQIPVPSRDDEAVAHIMATMGYTENLAKQTVHYRGGPEKVLADRDAAAAAAKAAEGNPAT